MNPKEIPIFFSIDNNYIPFLAAALNSAIKNSSPENNYKAIVMYQDVSEEHRNRLRSMETENFKIEFVPMEKGLESITDRMSNRLRCDYFTLTIFFRLFIPAMFPQYDKAIYIDSDVVINGDIAELYNMEIGDNYLGVCADRSVVEVPELALYMENAVGVNRYKYFNSGVLLMNLKLLRSVDLKQHFLSLLNTYHFDCIAPDQDYLNAMCCDKVYYLDETWDAMPDNRREALKAPKLIHYNLFSKPWCYGNIQYGEYFWEYAEDCGYLKEIIEYKESYSDEQKKSDSECLSLLIKRACEIAESDVTFKRIYERGIKIRL